MNEKIKEWANFRSDGSSRQTDKLEK